MRWSMAFRPLLFGSVLLALSPLLSTTAAAASIEEEYQQVRAIALRDRRVQEGYEEADRRLEAKILQIDPALKGYLQHRRNGGRGEGFRQAPRSAGPVRSAARPAERPQVPVKRVAMKTDRSHTVRQGETLGSIASIYGVTVAGLKAANRIEDERKLRVGQVLAVPPRIR
jgi:nucleoid-associated protein YgaU